MTYANTYANIKQDEFESALNALGAVEQVTVPGTKELVYHVETGVDGLAVRVYSSLTRDGSARDAGADAIRTLLWDTTYDKPVESSTRTNRIQTWEKNLAKKVLALRVAAEARAGEGDENADAYDALPAATGAKDEIVVGDIITTRYGKKVALESPFAAKDAIKALDWDETHRAWDGERKAWTVDADALAAVVDGLTSAGWTVAKPAAEEAEAEDEALDMDELALGVVRGDEITVTYVSKTSKREMTKTGVVRRGGADGRISFNRAKDGHTMFVTKDGLFTARSAHPFVGSVVGVEVTER